MAVSVTKSIAPHSVPERIGKYLIINEVGRGSTGIVYLSHDPYYGRDVAIKVYNVDSSGDENRKRFDCGEKLFSVIFISIHGFRQCRPVKETTNR